VEHEEARHQGVGEVGDLEVTYGGLEMSGERVTT
jgi:hypothetical protein